MMVEEFLDTNSNKPYQQPVSSAGSLEQGGKLKEITDTITMTTIPGTTAAAGVAAIDKRSCVFQRWKSLHEKEM